MPHDSNCTAFIWITAQIEREREKDGGRDRKYCEERQMQKWKSPSIENQMLIHRSLSLGRDGSNTCGMVRQFHSDQVHLPAPNPQLARLKPNLFTEFYSSIVSCFTKGRHMRLSLVCNVYPIFFQMTIVFVKNNKKFSHKRLTWPKTKHWDKIREKPVPPSTHKLIAVPLQFILLVDVLLLLFLVL